MSKKVSKKHPLIKGGFTALALVIGAGIANLVKDLQSTPYEGVEPEVPEKMPVQPEFYPTKATPQAAEEEPAAEPVTLELTADEPEAEEDSIEVEILELTEPELEAEVTRSAPEVVYIASDDSDKYHVVNCRWAKNILPENLMKFSSREEAEAAGYEPCATCII